MKFLDKLLGRGKISIVKTDRGIKIPMPPMEEPKFKGNEQWIEIWKGSKRKGWVSVPSQPLLIVSFNMKGNGYERPYEYRVKIPFGAVPQIRDYLDSLVKQ